MSDEINRRRRRLLGSAAVGVGALNLRLNGWADAQSISGTCTRSNSFRQGLVRTRRHRGHHERTGLIHGK